MLKSIFNPARSIVITLAIVATSSLSAQAISNFSGNFSSEGDITAKGLMTMEITQNKAKLEGTSSYQNYDGQSDTGMLSVNGYVKGNTGYIRFRDQRGNTVADGSIRLQDASTLNFKQTGNNTMLPKEAFLFIQGGSKANIQTKPAPIQNEAKSYAGKYSNQGDTTAKGIFSFDISQSGSKIEGIATYKDYSGQVESGVLSVNGYVKDGIAYIRFRDQRANTIADGALHYDANHIIFRQTTLSDFVPHYAVLHK